jgi:V/A-type H+/Na+-transporting ATPase subunit D
MSQSPATRTELLHTRQRTTFAQQGRDLLKDKRTALVREFRTATSDLLTRVEHLHRQAAQARAELDHAVAVAGAPAIVSPSLSFGDGVPVELSTRIVAGVAVVELTHDFVGRAPADRGFALPVTTAYADVVAQAHEREVEQVLDVAAAELTARRLAAEIARTTRQVNALDNIVVPRLRAETRRIVLVLDEREREERSRLRRARARRTA